MTENQLREKTATLARMLNLQGTIGMFGHVSIRVPGTDKCFISPGATSPIFSPSSSIPAA